MSIGQSRNTNGTATIFASNHSVPQVTPPNNQQKNTQLTNRQWPRIKHTLQRKRVILPGVILLSVATAASIMYLHDSRRFNPMNFYNLVIDNKILFLATSTLTIALFTALIYTTIKQYRNTIVYTSDKKSSSMSLDEQNCPTPEQDLQAGLQHANANGRVIKSVAIKYDNDTIFGIACNTVRRHTNDVLDNEDIKKSHSMSRIGLLISNRPTRVTVPFIGLIVINATIFSELLIAYINLNKVIALIKEDTINPTKLINALDDKMLTDSLDYEKIIQKVNHAKLVHAVDFTKLTDEIEKLSDLQLIDISDRTKLINALDPAKLIDSLKDKSLKQVLRDSEKLITSLDPKKLIDVLGDNLADVLDYDKLANAVKHVHLKKAYIGEITALKNMDSAQRRGSIALIRKLDHTILRNALKPQEFWNNIEKIKLEKMDPTDLIHGLDPEKLIGIFKTNLINALDHKNLIHALDPIKLIDQLDPKTLKLVLQDSDKLIRALDPQKLIEVLNDITLAETLDYNQLASLVRSTNLGQQDIQKIQHMVSMTLNERANHANIQLIRKLDHTILRNALDPNKFWQNIEHIELKKMDPSDLIHGLDPEKLIKTLNHKNLIDLLDDTKLSNVLNPKKLNNIVNDTQELINALNHTKLINTLDPQKLIKLVEDPKLINALDRTKLISVLDHTTLKNALNYTQLTSAANAVGYFDQVQNFYLQSATGSVLCIISCLTALYLIYIGIHCYKRSTTTEINIAVLRPDTNDSRTNPAQIENDESQTLNTSSSSTATVSSNSNISVSQLPSSSTGTEPGSTSANNNINRTLIQQVVTQSQLPSSLSRCASTRIHEMVVQLFYGPDIIICR